MSGNMPFATRLCLCWKLTRKDGSLIGFTDHDRDLTVAGIIYFAQTGVAGTDIDRKIGFATDNAGLAGLLGHDRITKADIKAGLYGGAKVEIFRVDWGAPASPKPVWTGHFGAIEQAGDAFTVELIGQAAQLSRSAGRVFSRLCDARLGDKRCGLNLSDLDSETTCPRTFSACRDQFSNSINYRGFPYLIGDDAMAGGPDSSPALDGRSRYSDIL